MGVALGWTYGIVLVGYFVGFGVSGWRLRKVRKDVEGNLELVAFLALAAGWPTGWRVVGQVQRRERALASLVNPRTRPALVAFAVVLVPFMALIFVPDGEWKMWVSAPLGLVGLALACATWPLDARGRLDPA
jgi:hypothetical protein